MSKRRNGFNIWLLRAWEDVAWSLVGMCVLSLALWAGFRAYNGIKFDAAVTTHMKLASNAITPDQAVRELDSTLAEVRALGLTRGSTSIFSESEDEDLGLWYGHLQETRLKMSQIRETSSDESVAIVMMNIRDSSTYTRTPDGISIYGKNKLCCWWALLSLLVPVLIGLFAFFFGDALERKARNSWMPA